MNAPQLKYLQDALASIEDLLKSAVERVEEAGGDPGDALRGLVFSNSDIQAELARTPLVGWWNTDGFQFSTIFQEDTPLSNLIHSFDLNAVDVAILLLCLAPELDRRYERVYGYLQDDVTLRRPTLQLLMNLIGGDLDTRFEVWARLQPSMPLMAYKLVEVLPDPARAFTSFLSQPLKLDGRVLNDLLGVPTVDMRVKDAVRLLNAKAPSLPLLRQDIEALKSLDDQWDTAPIAAFYTSSMNDGLVETLAMALCAERQQRLISIDAAKLARLGLPIETAWQLALREGFLYRAALLIEHWETGFDIEERLKSNDEETISVTGAKVPPPHEIWSMVMAYPQSIILAHLETWEPRDTDRQRRVLRIHLRPPDYDERHNIWSDLLQHHDSEVTDEQLDELAAKFRFTPHQTAYAIQSAADFAASRGDNVNLEDLYAGARAHSALRLGKLVRGVVPKASWDDLILPPEHCMQLREITERARFADLVHDNWGFGRKMSNVGGVSALFAGESGTGKTLAAEVIAHELGLALYTIDLSGVVSKYIGETEKNLNIIFEEARASSAILFFDEADALFGKRSEVKDARDRYANIEIAYLLQQIETYDGVTIMATNLRQNIDDAFTRRLDFLIDFPFPEPEYRLRLWAAHFPREAPLASDVDLSVFANQFRLAGGNIRNAVIASAFLAASNGGVITSEHIRSAIRREHQKMGRLLNDL